MRTIDIKKAFIETCYNGDRGAYLKARKRIIAKYNLSGVVSLTPYAKAEKLHNDNMTGLHFRRLENAEVF